MSNAPRAKVILLICDGLGDWPLAELGDKTPLEAAHTPHLDRFAAEGITGMMWSLGRGLVPGSDVAHLSIFGYDIERYYSGRGPIELRGIGIPLQKGDVAWRANLATVDGSGTIVDRRAGRVESVVGFVEELDGTVIDDVQFIVKPGTAHRAGLIMRGPGLSAAVEDVDPHRVDVPVREPRPRDGSKEARRTAGLLARFLKIARQKLEANSLNADRVKAGLLPANYMLVRGAGSYMEFPSLKKRYGMDAVCVAGGGLYKGVAAYVGMHVASVPGATGLPGTDVRAKFRAARDFLKEKDFVFVHVKPTDSLAEDGNHQGKLECIEAIDRAAEALVDMPNTLLVVTGDHSTPCALMRHSADPVPILAHGPNVRTDGVWEFGERSCVQGGLGYLRGVELMPEILNWVGLAKLQGA